LHTGALEGLHQADRGVTLTIVQHDAWQQAVEIEAGLDTVGHVEASMRAFDLALDLATGATPISEAAVRGLHELATAHQTTYEARVAVGDVWKTQLVRLERGAYKVQPNHVQTIDGGFHSYCPVDQVSDEVRRLVSELSSDAFLASHPVVQAAYAHYALVAVHPFADGNGRVGRLLASTFLLRDPGVPLIVYADQKAEYLSSLRATDMGRQGEFVRFVFDRALDAIEWVTDALYGSDLKIDGPDLVTPAEKGRRRLGLSRLIDLVGLLAQEEIDGLDRYHDESWSIEHFVPGARRLASDRELTGDRALRIHCDVPLLNRSFARDVATAASQVRAPMGVSLVSDLRNGTVERGLRDEDLHPEIRQVVHDAVAAFVRRVIADLIDEISQAVRQLDL
jgi:hypothetical protein